MNDEELLAEFEACTLAGDRFHHRDHVRLVWIYLERFAPLEARRPDRVRPERRAGAPTRAGARPLPVGVGPGAA